ncbi:MAG: hypothetical protein HY719_02850 [Planctomycetes bacterium]|nr:hypothetical protein [Planctomycetota bacterium]
MTDMREMLSDVSRRAGDPLLWGGLGVGLMAATCLGIAALAFRESKRQGFLCLLVPLYFIYYMTGRMKHPNRSAILLTFCFALGVLAMGAVRVARYMEAREIQDTEGGK